MSMIYIVIAPSKSNNILRNTVLLFFWIQGFTSDQLKTFSTGQLNSFTNEQWQAFSDAQRTVIKSKVSTYDNIGGGEI